MANMPGGSLMLALLTSAALIRMHKNGRSSDLPLFGIPECRRLTQRAKSISMPSWSLLTFSVFPTSRWVYSACRATLTAVQSPR